MASTSSSCSCSSSSSGEIESPFALLEAVEAAILAVCSGQQSYRLMDTTVTLADLGELRKMRRELKGEIAQIQGTRPLGATLDARGIF